MFHVFRLGPIPIARRPAWLVGAIDEFGAVVQPVLDQRLEKALMLMVEGLGEEDFTLEPALAAFAQRLGAPVAPRPDYLQDAPAVLAFSAVNNHAELPRGTGIHAFLEACRDFGAVAPWDRYRCDQPIRMALSGPSREATREAVILGGHGEPCGFALYDRPGLAMRCIDALRRGDGGAARRLDAMTLVFGPEPAWALQAVRSAFSLPEFPWVFRTQRGQIRATTQLELALLTVALRAVTLLGTERSSSGHGTDAVLCIDGDEFQAQAFPPEQPPGPRPAQGLPAGSSRRLH
ncbi:MAG TPA: hypothetical protein VFI53_09530 [Myxococcaceae bacterium]|nr:hypothetical protein [Myxococcaceae bacterium]